VPDRLPHLLDPWHEVRKGLAAREVEHREHTRRPAEVRVLEQVEKDALAGDVLVDEVETITNPRDYATLLHLMENQQVVEAKYGRHNIVPLSTSVFAAGNDLSRLDPALISRFGGPKCVVHFKEYTPKEFLEVTVNVLVKREGVVPEFARKVAEAMLSIQTLDVRAAVHVARLAEDEDGLAVVVDTIRRRRQ